jgi:hypothetical protein
MQIAAADPLAKWTDARPLAKFSTPKKVPGMQQVTIHAAATGQLFDSSRSRGARSRSGLLKEQLGTGPDFFEKANEGDLDLWEGGR